MKTTHTPAPWTITEHSWSATGIYADSIQIAQINIYDEATEENQEALEERTAANARLIAAAPDLLEALQGAKKILDELRAEGIDYECSFIDSVLAKAVAS